MNIFRSSFLLITLALTLFLGENCWAQNQKTDLYFFYNPLCPVCQQTEISLNQLKAKYPYLEIKRFNILSSRYNQEIYNLLSQAYQVKFDSVPGIFIEEKAFNKFSPGVISQIEQILIRCARQKCSSPQEKLLNQLNKKEEKKSPSLNIKIIYWLIPFILIFLILKRKKSASS
jgi:thiol-disulfide isomerase/thioredoxin